MQKQDVSGYKLHILLAGRLVGLLARQDVITKKN